MGELKQKYKVEINITKNEHKFIDGTTGEQLSKEEFDRKYKKVSAPYNGVFGIETQAPEGKREAGKI